MSRVFERLFRVLTGGPVALAVLVWSLLLVWLSMGLTGYIAYYVWYDIDHYMKAMSFSVEELALNVSLPVVLWVPLVLLTLASARSALARAGRVADDARGVVEVAREVIDTRARDAARLEAQDGQISLSVGDGAGGGLSEVKLDVDGLEVVGEAAEVVEEVAHG